MTFPTPIGGASILPEDLAPSVVFAILYGCLLPLVFYRLIIHRRSRTLLIAGCASFATERIVVLALRANASQTPDSNGPVKYMQTTLGIGFLSVCLTFKDLVQCYLVNATYGSETCSQAPVIVAAKQASSTRTEFESILAAQPILEVVNSPEHIADLWKARFIARRLGETCLLNFLAALIVGIVAAIQYSSVLENGSSGHMAMLRYLSVGLAFITLLLEGAMILWGYRFLSRTSKPAFRLLATVWCLLFTITIYRAAVVHNTTSSFTSTESGALDSPTDKALFYVFQILPEWLAVLALFGANAREVIGCGAAGDWRGRDETKAEKAKREAREGVQAVQREEVGVEGISAVPLRDLN